MAGIYNGHILEFPQIRVDCFTSAPPSSSASAWRLPTSSDDSAVSRLAPPAQLFLLTHVHSDHLLGLSDGFTGRIVCSPDTKRMLLRLEAEASRQHFVQGTKERVRRKYDGLRGRWVDKGKKGERFVDIIVVGGAASLPEESSLLPKLGMVGEADHQHLWVLTQRVMLLELSKGADKAVSGTSFFEVTVHEAVPYGLPKEYEIGFDDAGVPQIVTITLLDANHCPGSTMFLIASPDKAVLHTGDIRCDRLFMQTLRRNPAVQQFIAPSSMHRPPIGDLLKAEPSSAASGMAAFTPVTASSMQQEGGKCRSGRRVLDRIYLDTGAVLGTGDMPDKEEAIEDLLQQMSLYPDDTVFFLNVWCFGWEDVVKSVARHFESQVHVDRYKRSIYTAVKSDPFLSACTTEDDTFTRFHACERRWKCHGCRTFDQHGQRVWNKDTRVVHVNMVEVKSASWAMERKAFLEQLSIAAKGDGYWPTNILCPIARHSPLPELQALVSLFRPRVLSPNCVVPQAMGLDYFLLPSFFEHTISLGAYDLMIRERDAYFLARFGREHLGQMKALQAAGIDLTSLEKDEDAEREEIIPDPGDWGRVGGARPPAAAANTTRIGTGRKAHALDQAKRAGGVVVSSMAELRSILGGNVAAEVLGRANAGFGSGPSGRQGVNGAFEAVDTDDEDSDLARKKRRRRGNSAESGSIPDAQPLRNVDMDRSTTAPLRSPTTRAGRTPKATRTSTSTLSRCGASMIEAAVEAPAPSSRPPRATSGRQSRFLVDKEHLRALASVCHDEV